jgi:hypothetical protein
MTRDEYAWTCWHCKQESKGHPPHIFASLDDVARHTKQKHRRHVGATGGPLQSSYYVAAEQVIVSPSWKGRKRRHGSNPSSGDSGPRGGGQQGNEQVPAADGGPEDAAIKALTGVALVVASVWVKEGWGKAILIGAGVGLAVGAVGPLVPALR